MKLQKCSRIKIYQIHEAPSARKNVAPGVSRGFATLIGASRAGLNGEADGDGHLVRSIVCSCRCAALRSKFTSLAPTPCGIDERPYSS